VCRMSDSHAAREPPFGSDPRTADTYYRLLLEQGTGRGVRPFNHAFAGVVVYFRDSSLFLLQERDGETTWNPNKVSIFGGRVREDLRELPTQAAIRELSEETGIQTSSAHLRVLRAYVESRPKILKAPVFRAIFYLVLDQLPQLRKGEGRSIVLSPAIGVQDSDKVTPLSREDVLYFWDSFGTSFNELGAADSADLLDREPEGATHSSDFTFVNWFGVPYYFTLGNQSHAVEALWAEWEKGELGLHERTIGQQIGSSAENFRLVHVFRGHPAWGQMIRDAGPRGCYRLVPPESTKNH